LRDASYDANGTVLNQVQESYDAWATLWAMPSRTTGPSARARRRSIKVTTNPRASWRRWNTSNGRTLSYGYTNVGQITGISDGSGTLASYSYLGLDTPISTTDGNGVVENTTLDAFGRVAEEKYTNSSGTAIDDISYGYDNDGNVLYEQNNVLPGQSQLFTYDGLNRLTGYSQGTLNSSKTGMTSTSASESWQLDALGNWKSSTQGSTTTTRSNNAENEATTIGTATLGYDADGNTTTESGQQFVYDAWNRLVAVKDRNGDMIASYSYDALGRRMTQTENGTTTDLYYSTNWQVVEERQGSTTTRQYVWSPFYVDQLIERDDQSNGSGTLTRRLYAEQDADYNVTSITDSNGNVVERYSYDPYGNVTVENADGSIKGNGTASASGYGWIVLHQGLMLDNVTGTYDDRNREYDPTLGRFLQQDPAAFIDGLDRYRFERDSPVLLVDPTGLIAPPIAHRGQNWQPFMSILPTGVYLFYGPEVDLDGAGAQGGLGFYGGDNGLYLGPEAYGWVDTPIPGISLGGGGWGFPGEGWGAGPIGGLGPFEYFHDIPNGNDYGGVDIDGFGFGFEFPQSPTPPPPRPPTLPTPRRPNAAPAPKLNPNRCPNDQEYQFDYTFV
jgi:RHS repeat-associated protein